MMTAREEILARIRAAIPQDAAAIPEAPLPAPTYERKGSLSREACLELLRDRLLDYDADVVDAQDESDLPAAIAEALSKAREQSVVVAAEFPQQWLPAGFGFHPDHDLPISELDTMQAVVTPCEAAIAATGTLILVHGGAQGRRAITLLPDHHICLLRRAQVYELVPQAWEAIAAIGTQPITTISGPSATSDIEMTRVRGVHGPRRLTVILYGPLQ
jgi:L-lactate dehydrogenase complex protein LldG